LQRDRRRNFFEQIKQAKGFALECVAKWLVKLMFASKYLQTQLALKILGIMRKVLLPVTQAVCCRAKSCGKGVEFFPIKCVQKVQGGESYNKK